MPVIEVKTNTSGVDKGFDRRERAIEAQEPEKRAWGDCIAGQEL